MDERWQFEVPKELFAKITMYLEFGEIVKLLHVEPVRLVLESGGYWTRSRTLIIKSHDDLIRALCSPHSKDAQNIDLSCADIDDTDLQFLAEHFTCIRTINLSKNSDLTDDGIEHLLRLHGKTFQKLNLSRLFRLTNVSMENIARYCAKLKILILTGMMITAGGLQMIAEGCTQLRQLSLSRCHLMNPEQLPAVVERLPCLRYLELSNLDLLQAYQVQAIIQSCSKLYKVDLTGCAEITLKSIRELQKYSQYLEIVHDARLEDHSIDGIRRFLLGLTGQI